MKRSVPSAVLAAVLASSVALTSLTVPVLAQPAATAAAKDADPVIATINGTPIRASELAVATEDLAPGMPPQMPASARQEYVLSVLTDMLLLARAAEAQKLDQTPEFQIQLTYARTKALMETLLLQEARKALTDEAKHKTYDEFVKSAHAEDEVHARHILVDDEAQAREIAKKAKAGEDFAKLAKDHSKDGAEDGGDLGYFSREQMVPEFADAAFKLEKGQISDPVKSQFGWHVIKIEDKRKKPVPTYEQVENQVEQFLARKAQTDLVTKLRADAKVEKVAAPADAAAPVAAPVVPPAAK